MTESELNGAAEKKLMELATAMAEQLHANSTALTDHQGLRRRLASAISGGYDFSDTLHNIYLDFGYPLDLDFFNFWNMYRRFGIATNIIKLPVDTGWSTPPTIESSESFLRELERLNKRINLWIRLKGLDTRQRVGRYAGMFMRVRDGLTPDKPLENQLGSESALMEMMPLYESQLEVITSDEDPSSETFGQPIMIQYSQSITGSRNEEARNTISIHASRIVFVAEDADNGWIYGIPALEPVYNSLMDLRKIIGGGGEGFYKNASQSIVFDVKDGANALKNKDKLEGFNDEFDEFSRNRFRRAMWTPGMEAKTLDSTLMSPEHFFNAALNDVAAGSQIPATILIGQQTGRLASTEDSRQFLSVIQSRRENFMTEMTRSVFDWCIKFGVLPAAEYDVVWDDLLARSDSEKLDNADKMASVNEKQFKSGSSAVFTGEEIREAGGFEDDEIVEPGSESLGDEDEE
jgi:hypothetical protein